MYKGCTRVERALSALVHVLLYKTSMAGGSSCREFECVQDKSRLRGHCQMKPSFVHMGVQM